MGKIEKTIRTIIGKTLDINEVDIPIDASRDTPPQWDSVKHMTLMLALEDEFHIEFTDEEISSLASIVEISKAIMERNL